MSMFQLGQQVVCIESARPGDPMAAPYRGSVYTISEFSECPCERRCLMLQFEELRWEGNESYVPGFNSGSFRPCKATNIEIFQKLLVPTPELVS